MSSLHNITLGSFFLYSLYLMKQYHEFLIVTKYYSFVTFMYVTLQTCYFVSPTMGPTYMKTQTDQSNSPSHVAYESFTLVEDIPKIINQIAIKGGSDSRHQAHPYLSEIWLEPIRKKGISIKFHSN